jgi:hypothetical protein
VKQIIQSFIVNSKGLKMTQSQALTQALLLALTAPSDQKSQMASDLAEQIAYGLTEKQVNQCKVAALKIWHNQEVTA